MEQILAYAAVFCGHALAAFLGAWIHHRGRTGSSPLPHLRLTPSEPAPPNLPIKQFKT